MNPLLTTIPVVVGLLGQREYGVIESMTRGERLSAEMMQRATARSGRTLVVPPSNAWNEVSIYEVTGSDVPTFAVDVPLWSAEEGRSDLSLVLTLVAFKPGLFNVVLDDIRVLEEPEGNELLRSPTWSRLS